MTVAVPLQRPRVPPAGPSSAEPAADRRLSVAVVLYLAMIAVPIHFNLGPIFMTGVRAVLLVMIVPLTLQLFAGRFGRLLATDVLLLVYGVWSVFTLALNSPAQAVSFGGSYVLEVYGSCLLARAFVRTPGQFRAACAGLFAVLLFSLPFALYETQTGWAPLPQLVSTLPGIFSFVDFYNEAAGRRLGLERSQVMFAHPIHYGVFSASLFSLAMVGLRDRVSMARRLLRGGAVCLGVVCSVSSGAILPMMLQVFLMVWAAVLGRVRTRWTILTAITVVCHVVVDLLSNRTPIVILLEQVALSPDTAYGRVIIFAWGMVNVWKHPFFGIGLNDWERPWWKLSASMDNFWLLTTVRYGIPGFLMLVWAYSAVVWGAMRRDLGAAGEAWRYRRAWVFSQMAMIMALCTVDVWSTALSCMFFLFGMGAWFLTAEAGTARSAAEPAGDAPPVLPRTDGRPAYTRFPAAARMQTATVAATRDGRRQPRWLVRPVADPGDSTR